jgi:hypothetical protein
MSTSIMDWWKSGMLGKSTNRGFEAAPAYNPTPQTAPVAETPTPTEETSTYTPPTGIGIQDFTKMLTRKWDLNGIFNKVFQMGLLPAKDDLSQGPSEALRLSDPDKFWGGANNNFSSMLTDMSQWGTPQQRYQPRDLG